MAFTYPRFTRAQVDTEIQRLEDVIGRGDTVVSMPDGGHNPGAIFAPDGIPVPDVNLSRLHAHVADRLDAAAARAHRADRDRQFDRVAGAALVSWFEEEGRGPAAHPDIWPYLTLVALPDLAIRRFGPDSRGRLPRERYIAGRRNIFQRLYLRSWILGDLLDDPDLPLFEDELVGLVDRNLSSDHRLARFVGESITELDKTRNRRDPVRSGFKNLQFELRVTDVASLDDKQLRRLVTRMFAG